MTPPRWVIVHEGHGPVSPGSRKMVERLVKDAGLSTPLTWMNITSSTVSQARKEGPDTRAKLRADDHVLTLGSFALMEVREDKAKPAIFSERGRLQWTGAGQLVMPSFDPAAVWSDPELFRDFARDVIKWATFSAPVDLPWPDYYLPETTKDLLAKLGLLQPYAEVSLDIETSGLDPLTDEILSIGFGTADGPVIIVGRHLLKDPAVADALWDVTWGDALTRIVFQNVKFDLAFLTRWWGAMPDGSGARIGDTMLLHYMLDERPVRSRYRTHGLKDQARTRYDVADYHFDFEAFHARLRGDEGTEPLTEADWESMYGYHAMDCRITAMLWKDLVLEAAEESPDLLTCHDNLLIPATIALTEAELRGVPVDREYLLTEKRRLERRLERRKKALQDWVGDPEFLPGSPTRFVKVIKECLGVTEAQWPGKISGAKAYARKTKTPTGIGEIQQLVARFQAAGRHHDARFLSSVLAWRQDSKNLSTYVDGLLDHIGPDGRVHPSFNVGGTVTGRLSATEPNLQAIPREGSMVTVRRAFVADPGWVLMEADFSQLELRTAAMLSEDPDLSAVYQEGRDLHLEVAAMLFRRAALDISDEERFMAKALNFGILYGRSGWAISKGEEMTYAVEELGMERWTPGEGDAYIKRWMGGFPRLADWIEEMKEKAAKVRYTETPFGRRRRFFLTRPDGASLSAFQRQAVNTPVQSVASDICLNSFAAVNEIIDRDEARLISIVHDSVWLEVREDVVDKVAAQVKAIMETPPYQWTGVPLVVDIKVGRVLADAKKVKN